MALNTKIDLGERCCGTCKTPFADGNVIFHSDEYNRSYCSSVCAADPLASKYIVDKNVGKLVLDHPAFDRLGNGIYELEQVGEHLVVEREDSDDGLVIFRLTGYILEKRDNGVFVLFPEGMIRNKYDFLDAAEEYCFIMDYLQEVLLVTEGRFLICSQKDEIVGVASTLDVFVLYSCFKSVTGMTLDELGKQYRENALIRDVSRSLKKLSPQAMLTYCEKRIQGQGVALKLAAYQIYRYMQCVARGEEFRAENWILTAPSGAGKTEFFRTVKDLFRKYDVPIPVVQIDLSQITETGYKGNNVSTIPQRILTEKPSAKGVAICFLDEADKKCIPSYGANGIDNNAAVQANLLTLIEGSSLKVEMGDEQRDFDSNLTMFVLMGTFQSIRQRRQEKRHAKPLGFGVNYGETDRRDDIDRVEDEFYEDLSLQDMIDFGMREELAGRMVQVVNFHKLSEEDMLALIRCKVKEISESMGIVIEMEESAEKDFLDISFGSLGVRRPMNMIRELVQNTVAEVFFDGEFENGRDKVVIESAQSAHIERRLRKE